MTKKQLAAWRKRLGLTQGSAALLLGCGRRSLQQWEHGIHAVPRYIELACKYLEAEDEAMRKGKRR